MKRRVTYIHSPIASPDAQLSGDSLSITGLDAAKEERITLGVDEIPIEVRAYLQDATQDQSGGPLLMSIQDTGNSPTPSKAPYPLDNGKGVRHRCTVFQQELSRTECYLCTTGTRDSYVCCKSVSRSRGKLTQWQVINSFVLGWAIYLVQEYGNALLQRYANHASGC